MHDTHTPAKAEHSNVISLKEAMTRYRGGCKHLHIVVDEYLSEVECSDCGKKLNPMAVLLRFAREESRLARERERVADLLSKLSQRVRCKCDHCGKFTGIRV